MITADLLNRLGYTDSPNFLRPGAGQGSDRARDFGHIFRRAHRDLGLKGVYTLRDHGESGRDTVVPVVYVCQVPSEQDATRVHRLVWNQNVVPFLIVVTPKTVRIYQAFEFTADEGETEFRGAIGVAHELTEAIKLLDGLHAPQIDSGLVWEKWGKYVRPERRVQWRLLAALDDLDSWLMSNGVDDLDVSHALIGKFVYLHYLRHRDILSDKKLKEWDVDPSGLFSRNISSKVFWRTIDRIDDWLNGSTFPIPPRARAGITEAQLRMVAGTFAGDQPRTGQRALDLAIYNFSVLPIETLSVIYEQFLHVPRPGRKTPGKTTGAYYTPVPVVNFMLEELDDLHPFKQGMRVLDPACGSGAFLVQCYRRIVERDEEFNLAKPMRPARLRELLVDHIFGIDRAPDACRVAELSLTLTLLDYVDPPDLSRTPSFKLPLLRETNIFQGDFFDPGALWRERIGTEFDWIVGNPPWIELQGANITADNKHALTWINENAKTHPTGGRQVAEAFAWEASSHAATNGHIALLLPAMTLFKDESQGFRESFFSKQEVRAVANFANLSYVLFPGHKLKEGNRTRARHPERPAAAFFYRRKGARGIGQPITVFSPFVAEQIASRPTAGERADAWNIVVDASQLTEVNNDDAGDGAALPWKLAMWGSHLHRRLLESVAARAPSLEDVCKVAGLKIAQGFELRTIDSDEPTEHLPELAGENQLLTSKLRMAGHIFEFPDRSMRKIQADECYLRSRGGRAGLAVSKPPHVIVDKGRRFAVYSDDFIAVPPRQIGIAGSRKHNALLKALSLYLISDFALFHQFVVSPEWGVSTSISTLDALRVLPTPLATLDETSLEWWAALRDSILDAQRTRSGALFGVGPRPPRQSLTTLLKTLNERVYDLLQLREDERALVEDFVHIQMELVKGKVARGTIGAPDTEEIRSYAAYLKKELDEFVSDQKGLSHEVLVGRAFHSAMVSITLVKGSQADSPRVLEIADNAFDELRRTCERALLQDRQWMYFRRNLRIYRGRSTFLLKPLERLHWTRTQAMLDASAIISETLA